MSKLNVAYSLTLMSLMLINCLTSIHSSTLMNMDEKTNYRKIKILITLYPNSMKNLYLDSLNEHNSSFPNSFKKHLLSILIVLGQALII